MRAIKELIQVLRSTDEKVIEIASGVHDVPVGVVADIRRSIARGRIEAESIALANGIDLSDAPKPEAEADPEAGWEHFAIEIAGVEVEMKAARETVERLVEAIRHGEHGERRTEEPTLSDLQTRLAEAKIALLKAQIRRVEAA